MIVTHYGVAHRHEFETIARARHGVCKLQQNKFRGDEGPPRDARFGDGTRVSGITRIQQREKMKSVGENGRAHRFGSPLA